MWDRTFPEHVDAAAAGGWDGISVIYPSYQRARNELGLSDADMRAMLADRGVYVDEIEVCHEWIYGSGPEKPLAQEPGLHCKCGLCAPVEDMIAMAKALGAQTVVATHRIEPVPVDVAAQRLARFCDRLADEGMRVAIEFLPYNTWQTVGQTWEVIEASGRENAGFCFDTHHHLALGGGNEEISLIPPDRVFILQITDGPLLPAGASREELLEKMTSRPTGFAPGEGELDIAATLEALERQGVRCPVGLETRKTAWADRPATEVSIELRAIMDRYLDAADAAANAPA
jgi:sugar phosphate isomerase/epimerase